MTYSNVPFHVCIPTQYDSESLLINVPEDKYEDHLCRVRDYNGDCCWRMMRMGSYMPIGIEELTKDEREHLNELYDE